jgi:hypothetical protein
VSGVNALGTGGSHLECDDFIVRPEVDPEMLLKPVYILTWNVGEHGTSADVRIRRKVYNADDAITLSVCFCTILADGAVVVGVNGMRTQRPSFDCLFPKIAVHTLLTMLESLLVAVSNCPVHPGLTIQWLNVQDCPRGEWNVGNIVAEL